MIIDTHVHYNLDPLHQNWQQHWRQAQKHGVTSSVVVGTDIDSSLKAMRIADAENSLYAAVGVHPHHYSSHQNIDDEHVFRADLAADQAQLKQMIGPQVVAIGETGLDYFRLGGSDTRQQASKKAQQLGFKMHLALAKEHDLPVIIHVRDKTSPEQEVIGNAYWDVYRIVKQWVKETGTRQNKYQPKFVLHCVSGPLLYVQKMIALGAYVGVAGNITYPKADQLRQLISEAPKDRVLVETDAPYLPPQEFRGQTCQPWMISQTVKFLEREFQMRSKELTVNTQHLFQKIK